MSIRKIFALGLAVISLVGISLFAALWQNMRSSDDTGGWETPWDYYNPEDAVDRATHEKNFRLISNSDQVLAYKIKGTRMLEGPKSVPLPLQKIIIAALNDPKTYNPEMVTACVPMYGAMLKFVQKQETVIIRFCFQCGYMDINNRDMTAFESNSLYQAITAIYPDFDESKIQEQF